MTDRLRFAPSPTGYLHVGGARTALFNWLHARRVGGELILRIEDTDTERSRPEMTEGILAALAWLGIDTDGDPVLQSTRTERHLAAARELSAGGRAYYCQCSSDEVAARVAERGGPPGYDGYCRDRGLGPAPGAALRFRTPDDGVTAFDDLVRGHVEFDNARLEDFVLVRSSGAPTFLLANLVDDAEGGITHVVRGEEHLNGTPKYLCLGDALGLDHHPVFAHLPILVDRSRRKLSKRRDSVAVEDFRARGYLPEAMVNYLALLGWGPRDGVEVRPLGEIVELFRLEDVSPSPAFFDEVKLSAFNAEHLRSLSPAEFVARAEPFLARGKPALDALGRLAPLVQERVRRLDEVEPMIAFLVDDEPYIDPDAWSSALAKAKVGPALLDEAAAGLEALGEWSAAGIRQAIEAAMVRVGLVNAQGGAQLAKGQGPLRVATTGRGVGPPLFESLEALGRDRTVARLRAARARA